MEATMFSGWIYDHLKPHATALKVAHPLMLRAIAAAKKKNDRIDANKICDCLRCDFLPECYMAPAEIRERRRTLRYRSLLVRQMVQMKIKIGTLLMEAGVSYNKQKLHKVGYFRELLATNPDIHEGLRPLLCLCRETVVRLSKLESALVRSLERDQFLVERVERLMSIPSIGPITALTWALEVGEVQRFSSIKKAISYCGLCGDEQRSGNSVQRTPLSKQRIGASHTRPWLASGWGCRGRRLSTGVRCRDRLSNEHRLQPRSISGLEDRGPRDFRGAHRQWWKGLWKSRRRYHRESGEKQTGPSKRPLASQPLCRLSKVDGKWKLQHGK